MSSPFYGAFVTFLALQFVVAVCVFLLLLFGLLVCWLVVCGRSGVDVLHVLTLTDAVVCGLQSSLYGCCEDGVTPAQGN